MSHPPSPRLLLALTGTVLAGALVGCGSASSATGSGTAAPTAAAPTAAATPGAAPSGAPGPGGLAGIDFSKVQACLKAAGITVPTGVPSGLPSNLPSGVPSNLPSGGFNGTPPPGFTPGQGGGPGFLTDPKAQAALKACGITLPTGPPAGASTP